MLRTCFSFAIAAAVLIPIACRAASAEPHIVKVVLPDNTRMFPGPGADQVNNDCLGCHSIEMVETQPALTKSAWAAEVAKMIKVYKAPIPAEDTDAIVDYLARTHGKN